MPTDAELTFPLGTVIGLQGLKGEVKIRPQTNNPEILLEIKNVLARCKDGRQLRLTARSVRLDRRLLHVCFQDFPDRTSVEALVGSELFTCDSELLPLVEDEFWVRDLIGTEVFTTGGAFVGKVVEIIYGSSDLLEIRRDEDPPGKTILVPFVKALVPVVDMKARKIQVADVDGLLSAQ